MHAELYAGTPSRLERCAECIDQAIAVLESIPPGGLRDAQLEHQHRADHPYRYPVG
jgi:hypothetical protein